MATTVYNGLVGALRIRALVALGGTAMTGDAAAIVERMDAAAFTVTGALTGDLVSPALIGGLVLIVMLIGFTVMQNAFSGGGFLDHNNSAGLGKDTLFIAFTSTGRGECLASSNDGGLTFTWTPVTENSAQNNLRPIVPVGHGKQEFLLWFNGTYTTYTNFSTRVLARIGLLAVQVEGETFRETGTAPASFPERRSARRTKSRFARRSIARSTPGTRY